VTPVATSDDLYHAEISTFRIISGAYVYLVSRTGSILGTVWLPLAAAAVVLLLMFKSYFSLLAIYLAQPDARIASLTVGVAIALLFVWQFLYVIASARLAGFVYRTVLGKTSFPEKRAVAARLYAATLRLVLFLIVACGLDVAAVTLAARSLAAEHAQAIASAGWIFAALIFVVLSVRCAMLQPALAFDENRMMLRRAWQVTHGRSWMFLILWLALWVAPFLTLEVLGEVAIGPMLPAASATLGIVQTVRDLATNNLALFSICLTLAMSSTVAMILTTIGSCLSYEELRRTGV